MVAQDKIVELERRMAALGIKEHELKEQFILGSGPGGQKVNKTSSSVVLLHLPTGIEVRCKQSRSRELNRFLARRELCEKLEALYYGKKTKKELEAIKKKKQKKRRERRTKNYE